MTTTPQAALLREAAQNALITLDGIANANPRDKADFETPDEWIAWAKSRARFAADALRAPVAQEIYAERILRKMLHESDQAQSTQVEPVLTEEEIWFLTNGGMRNAAGGIYQSRVIEFARAVGQAVIAKLQATQEPAQEGELPDEREAFEAAVLKENTHAILKKRRNGHYQDDEVQALWWAWQARAALSARKPAVPLSKSQLSDIFEQEPRWHAPPIGATDIEFANDAIAEFCRINGLEVKP